jgi:hypothetical protein
MNTNRKFFLFCPIPEDQKPMNEYLMIKDNTITKWIIQKSYTKNIFILFVFLFFLSRDFFFTSFLFCFFLFFFFFQYIALQTRFTQSRLVYEEGSWYDGAIWEKPFLILKNDKLVVTQKIDKYLFFLSNTLLILFLLVLLGFLFR